MRIDDPEFHALNTASSKETRFVVAILYDADSIYVTSHADITGVPGTVIQGALSEPIVTSQRLNPDTANSEIGSASFSLTDIGSAFTDEVRERLDDGDGLRGRRVRVYLGYKGLAFEDFQLLATQDIRSISMHDGGYNVSCSDILRTLKERIFVMEGTTLTETVSAGATTITVADTSRFSMVFHGPSYSDSPSTTVGYFKLKNTVYKYTGKTSTTFTGCAPVFGTTAETITVDPSTPIGRREKITEVMYLELPAHKMMYALLTGILYEDDATLPDGWHLGIDPALINTDDFTGVGDTLWNLSDDSAGFKVRFLSLENQDGKKFIERELCLLTGFYPRVYADGRLGIRRMTRVTQTATPVATLDESNSISVNELRHDFTAVHNIFAVDWQWNGEKYLRTTAFADAVSRSLHGDAPLFRLQFKGLHGGVHTDGTIFTLLDQIRDRYAGPPLRHSRELLHSMNRLEIGDIVRVRDNSIRDFTAPAPDEGAPTLDRSFEIQNISVDQRSGKVTVDLFASTADASVNSPTTPNTALEDEWYESEGSALSAASGITIADDELTAATLTLSGHADLNNSAAIYYHDGDLTIASGVTLNIQHNVQLRVRGFLTINGSINGVGRGIPGVADDGRTLQYHYTDDGGAGNTAIPGTPGYVGRSRGYDGMVLRYYKGVTLFPVANTFTPAIVGSRFDTAPLLDLVNDGTSLTGLPSDLRGGGGAPGGRIIEVHPNNGTELFIPSGGGGGTGGNGGAGLLIVCRGLSFGPSGTINLSGADAEATPAVGGYGNYERTMYAGAGGGGGPGSFYLLVDGSNISVPDISRFTSVAGATPVAPANAFSSRSLNKMREFQGMNDTVSPVMGFYDPEFYAGNIPFSGAASRIQYIPAFETPVEDEDPRPPPCTNLTATGVELGIQLDVTLPNLASFDTIQIYASATNDRSGATPIYEGRASQVRHQLPAANTRYYWVRTVDTVEGTTRRVFSEWYPVDDDDGETATSTAGGTGPAGDSLTVEYSVNGTSGWHFPFASGDLYMRQQLGSGGWSAAMRIVGETGATGSTGATGNFIDYVFRRSATAPATPTGNTPSGWSDSPPAWDGNPLYISSAEKNASNVLIGTWSTPAIMAVDGEDGDDGLPGAQGPGLFTWAGATNVATTPDTITKNAGAAGFNAGAYSLQSYSTGSFVSARAANTSGVARIGLHTSATVAASPMYSWYCHDDGSLRAQVNSVTVATVGTFTTSTVLGIIHDGTTVQFFKDGVLSHTVNGVGVAPLYLVASLGVTGTGFIDIRFGPSGRAGANGANGANGTNGANAQTIRLTATASVFTYNVAGAADPGGQSITLTASRQNIVTATTWTTTPTVTLGGSGDTRTLSIADFGSNTSVRVRAAVGDLFDDVTITRLQAQGAIEAVMTNENVSLAANADGVVSDYSPAVGQITVFEGVTDRTSLATFALSSATNCTAQINTATDTPIAGQPRGYYRVTAVTADYAAATFTATYGSVTVTKTFNITRVRQGRAGDGANLLDVSAWVIGTTGSQGNFVQNGASSENHLVLGGAGSVPLGPTGASEPLWECRSDGDNGANGGWENTGDLTDKIDHAKSYRLTVPVQLNQMTGQVYLGCGYSETANLDGSPNTNPYFIGTSLASLSNAGMLPNKWYWLVGIIHGSGYTGGNTGIAGVYDPDSGIRIWQGTEYKNRPTATTQRHRAYHYYDTDTNVRQWFGRPRFEEINGNEQNLYELMGFRPTTPWVARGQMELSHSTIRKRGSGAAWDSDAQSIQSYHTCNLVFKPSQTTAAIMMGLSAAPATNSSYETIQYAIYVRTDGTLRIYESGSDIGIDYGPYTTATELSVTYDGASVRYFRDRVLLRTVALVGARLHMDSSFNTPSSGVHGVQFSSGSVLPQITSSELQASAVGTLDIVSGGLPIQSSTTVLGQVSFQSPHAKTVLVECNVNYDVEAVLQGYQLWVPGWAPIDFTRRMDVVLTLYVDYYVNASLVHTDGISLRVRPSQSGSWDVGGPYIGYRFQKSHTFLSAYSPTTYPSGNWQLATRSRLVIDTTLQDTYMASNGGHWQYPMNDNVLHPLGGNMGPGGSMVSKVQFIHGALSWKRDSMTVPGSPPPGSDL